MKINAYGSLLTESTPSLNASTAGTIRSSTAFHDVEPVPAEDSTSLTSSMASVQALTDAAFDTTSRTATVAALRQTVQSGQYTIDPARIAAALSKADV